MIEFGVQEDLIKGTSYLGAKLRATEHFEHSSRITMSSPAYRATLLIKYLEINDLSKVLFDGDIQG